MLEMIAGHTPNGTASSAHGRSPYVRHTNWGSGLMLSDEGDMPVAGDERSSVCPRQRFYQKGIT